jgi:Xaa-Pro aminopeptidase
MNARLKWLRNQLSSMELEGMIVSNPVNIKYLTGLDAEGVLLIAPKENIFITDSRYIEEVNHSLTLGDEIIAYNSRELSKYDYEGFYMICNNIGFEEEYVTYSKYQNLLQTYKVNFVETEGIIERQRKIKDEDEIEKIKKACQITDETFEYIIHNIKRGMTEKQVAFEIEKYMISKGADGLAFDTIVASGENSSKPHAVPTNRVIQNGDVLLFDMGAKYQGYCSDLSRTVIVGNENIYEDEYEFVLKEQKRIASNYKEGESVKFILKKIEDDYSEKGYTIMHAFGHNVGLEIHEEPALRLTTESYLKENMVLAIEPGIYDEGKFGIRIEDTYIITKNGCEQLTKCSKDYTKVTLKS